MLLFWLAFVVVERYVYCLVDVIAFASARLYICRGVVHAGNICLFSLCDFVLSLPSCFLVSFYMAGIPRLWLQEVCLYVGYLLFFWPYVIFRYFT